MVTLPDTKISRMVGLIRSTGSDLAIDCELCDKHHWEHVNGHCLYSPFKYQLGKKGVAKFTFQGSSFFYEVSDLFYNSHGYPYVNFWKAISSRQAEDFGYIAAFEHYDKIHAF